VGRVAAATHTEIHQIAIHDVSTTARQGAHGERFEGNSRTLSVFRPQFSPPGGAQPASGGRSRSELHTGGSNSAAASTTHGATRDPLPRASGGTTAAQPSSTGHFVTRADRPAAGAYGTAMTTTGFTRTTGTVRSDPAPRSVAPLILHGPDRSGQVTGNSSAGSVNQAAQPKPWTSTWRNDANPRPTVSPSTRPATETSRLRPTTSPKETIPRPTMNQTPQPLITSTWSSRVPSESAWSAPRAVAPPVRGEAPRQYTAPSYQAPAETRWSAPTPAPAPQQTHSYSAPTVSSNPRPQAMESHPSYSAPSAPAASAPASHSQSSSDKRGR
jgi:hypothetical protein